LKKTLRSILIISLIFILLVLLQRLGLFGDSFVLPLGTRLIFGIGFIVIAIILSIFLVGSVLRIFDSLEMIEVSLVEIGLTDALVICAAFFLMF